MIRGKFLTSQEDVSAVMDIRRRVFRGRTGYSADTEIDGFDKNGVYALAFDEKRPARRHGAAHHQPMRAAFRSAASAYSRRRAGGGWAIWWCACCSTGRWNWRGRDLAGRAVAGGGLLRPLRLCAHRRNLRRRGRAPSLDAAKAEEVNLEGSCGVDTAAAPAARAIARPARRSRVLWAQKRRPDVGRRFFILPFLPAF